MVGQWSERVQGVLPRAVYYPSLLEGAAVILGGCLTSSALPGFKFEFPAKTGVSSWLRSRLASVISSRSYILYALSYHDVPSSASFTLASWILSWAC